MRTEPRASAGTSASSADDLPDSEIGREADPSGGDATPADTTSADGRSADATSADGTSGDATVSGSVGPADGEAALVARLRHGEDDAYGELVAAYGARMMAVARRLLRNEDEAEDAVQDAFLSAFRSIDAFREDARLSTWLHRIAANAALMRLRSRSRRNETPIEDFLPNFDESEHFAHRPKQWEKSADDVLQDQELRARVRAAIDRLPDNYRTVLVLRDIEEFSTREAADLLEITPNAVKIRLHRARLALRELIDAEIREASP